MSNEDTQKDGGANGTSKRSKPLTAVVKERTQKGIAKICQHLLPDTLYANESGKDKDVEKRAEELDHVAKLLARKDRELTFANMALKERNKELNETTKVLIRRDRELMRINEKLLELDVMKTEFVSVAAHQLRTPLTGVKWTLYSLLEEDREDRLSEQQRKDLGEALIATERLITTINELLNVARLEEGRTPFHMKKQSLVPVLKGAFDGFAKTATDKGVSFRMDVPDELPEVKCDENQLAVAIEVLLDNAIKYTPPSGEIILSAQADEKRVTVSVRDTGIGIPKEARSQIFTKFYRAPNAVVFETSGNGLGLPAFEKIVKAHNAVMEFESEVEKGTTFSFSLPVAAE